MMFTFLVVFMVFATLVMLSSLMMLVPLRTVAEPSTQEGSGKALF